MISATSLLLIQKVDPPGCTDIHLNWETGGYLYTLWCPNRMETVKLIRISYRKLLGCPFSA